LWVTDPQLPREIGDLGLCAEDPHFGFLVQYQDLDSPSFRNVPVIPMPRTQKNDNFIDNTFTIMADLILKMLPTNKKAKEAFAYYRDGMAAQADGEYAEAMDNYKVALELEDDPLDRSFIIYNMGLIHASNGEHEKALELYQQSLDLNPQMPQALNNVAVIYHYQGEQLKEAGDPEAAEALFDQAADYWKQAVRIAPNNYIEAQNWMKNTGRSSLDIF
jgi:tetratricopeptide (TPR) repeat protein